MKITVLGAGAWGTALALQAAPRHEVLLWARNAQQAALMQRERCNARYLPGVPLPPALSITHDLDRALAHGRSGLTVVGTPMSGLRSMLQAVDAQAPVVWLCKGLEADTGLIGHELAAQVRP
ncbi:MAG: glycerol-3-phosphate dehydrogenase, partial [Betaproteobacteria bacterium]